MVPGEMPGIPPDEIEQRIEGRVIRSKTNRRHMTGEHHGQSAPRATVLVRAADEILGTHSSKQPDTPSRPSKDHRHPSITQRHRHQGHTSHG